ncbi:hypothetical protein K3M67_20345 (plasmid) [Sphingobium sp. V4]|uniref:hypothetical protein n=1 Tax=Sphingobium sp. V4 TaxID=3038927 RepID=UPI0025582669|nr:hypothetical protein [Sphingobium sp. V4]WIW90381.1 hypothetical protein K3M67_20345 [Sphingobium sp. V4]
MVAKLKVFRTPIGFHDAYVAAPSQKKALEAWGADSNLFARGVAEQVTDAKLMKAPLAEPGAVIKLPRGSPEQHLASLAQSKPPASRNRKKPNPEPASPRRPAKPRPRPSRAALDTAEQKLEAHQQALDAKVAELEERRVRLREEIRRLRAAEKKERTRLEAAIDAARQKYDSALARWRADS